MCCPRHATAVRTYALCPGGLGGAIGAAAASAFPVGVRSVLLAGEPPEIMAPALIAASTGLVVYSRAVAESLLSRVTGVATADVPLLGRLLSPREVQVLTLLCRGCTDRETATSLGISARTIHRHVANILNKMGARNRCQAVARFAVFTAGQVLDIWGEAAKGETA